VQIDGRDLTTIDPTALAQPVGVVMQDDRLLSRHNADNIPFCDPEIEHAACHTAAGKRSAYHKKDHLRRFPMGNYLA